MRRPRLLEVGLAVTLLAAAALAPPASAQDVVKLAIVAEITGRRRAVGEHVARRGHPRGRGDQPEGRRSWARRLESFVMDTQTGSPHVGGGDPPGHQREAVRHHGDGVQLQHRGQHGAGPAGRHPPDQRLGVGARRPEGEPQHLPDVLQPAGRVRQAGALARRGPQGGQDRADLRQQRLRPRRPRDVPEVPQGARQVHRGRHLHRGAAGGLHRGADPGAGLRARPTS